MTFAAVRATDLPVVSGEQMVEVDRIMIEELGIELLQMMENAGRNLAELARWLLGGSVAGQQVVVLAGSGHNGGGGLVAARHLANGGAGVDVILSADRSRLKPATALQLGILDRMQIPIRPPSILDHGTYAIGIDALLGYSTKGAPHAGIGQLIAAADRAGMPLLALDLPSGLDPETGIPMSPCVQAGATLTLAAPKTGLLAREARSVVGDLYVGDISVPVSVFARLQLPVPGPMFARGPIVRVVTE